MRVRAAIAPRRRRRAPAAIVSLSSPGPPSWLPRVFLVLLSASSRFIALTVWNLGVGLGLGFGLAEGSEAGKLQVVTSILPIYAFTRSVAGERASVENLLAPGADAHDFQFTPRERRTLDRAAVVFLNGLGMEPWLQTALSRSSARLRVVEVSAGLGDVPAGAGFNPHVWLDPVLACRMVSNILSALQEVDPGNAGSYAAQAHATVAGLERLHQELASRLQPFRGAAIVTYHDAFAYFARRYGLEVAGVIETVPDVAPTPGHLRALRETARRRRVKAIFTEPHHGGRLARQLGEDLNLPVGTLDTLESGALVADAYEAGMRRNVRVLEEFLR